MNKVMVFIIIFISCNSGRRHTPRPHQYPKIEYPDKSYSSYKSKECPFTMDLPTYASVQKKELLFDKVEADPCWFDIVMDIFGASIHCSYYPIGKNHTLDKLVNDAYTMASKHNVKASYREEFVLKNKLGSSGLIFKINGPVATPYQFYLTDSTHHFFRGSFYFNHKTSVDSVGSIIDFIEEDIDKMLYSLKWTN